MKYLILRVRASNSPLQFIYVCVYISMQYIQSVFFFFLIFHSAFQVFCNFQLSTFLLFLPHRHLSCSSLSKSLTSSIPDWVSLEMFQPYSSVIWDLHIVLPELRSHELKNQQIEEEEEEDTEIDGPLITKMVDRSGKYASKQSDFSELYLFSS